MSFQTKLKNMDLNLNLKGESDHLGLNDEVKIENNSLLLDRIQFFSRLNRI